jgi:RNA polymerase sigma-70 factor (ECF subfamily)
MYGKELYLYLYSLCHNSSMAEDLLQETFLKAMLSLNETHTNMRAWLYLVARNLCFNRLKQEKRISSLELVDNELLIDESADVIGKILLDERTQHLYQALSKLSGQKKEVLTMQYIGGLSQKEIAEVLHLTPENVRVISYRAKRELKLYMEEDDHDLS